MAADDFALFFQGLILAIGIVAVLLSPSYLRETGIDRGEYYALVLFAIVGMLGLVSALELVAVFVALEIMSVAVYALAGLHRDRAESQEAALKYFITGSFSSAFFLYGVALLYGLTGTHVAGAHRPGAADGRGRARRRRRRESRRGRRHRRSRWWARVSSSSASGSRWRACPSTCGRPTPTKERPRR